MAIDLGDMAERFSVNAVAVEAAETGFRQLAGQGVSFDLMRVMLVNRHGWTMTHATGAVETLERMTGTRLAR